MSSSLSNVSSYSVGPTEISVGEWVKFCTDEDLSIASSEQKAIYQENQRYLVISREDHLFDECRCYLIEILTGKMLGYCPRMQRLGDTDLIWVKNVKVFSRKSVEALYDNAKVQAAYDAAKKHLEDHAYYFKVYPKETLNVDTPFPSYDARLIRKFNSELEKRVNKDNLPGILAFSLITDEGGSESVSTAVGYIKQNGLKI